MILALLALSVIYFWLQSPAFVEIQPTHLTRRQVASTPRAVAGFAVGEFAALVAAGVMSYDQGLTVVKAMAGLTVCHQNSMICILYDIAWKTLANHV